MANTRDYIAAGMAGARGVRDNFIAARKNAVDYGVLGEANMKARSAQNVAITNATRGVMKAGINAKAKVENTKTKVEADKKVLDTKLGAKRFAGIVGGLGTVAVAGMSFAAPKDKEDSSWKDKHYAAQEALQLQMLERLKKEMMMTVKFQVCKKFLSGSLMNISLAKSAIVVVVVVVVIVVVMVKLFLQISLRSILGELVLN